jgi:hypothetical protein
VYFAREFSPKFDLKNVILTYAKDFSWKKWLKFTRFNLIFFQIVKFLWYALVGNQEYKMISFLFYFRI